jgi:pimeloyl-ACP methyl ester carboxylesterase
MVLADGRTLSWAEFGDPRGDALLIFHGWPGSRLIGGFFDAAARALGIRLVCPDRPGVGGSSYLSDRRITDWPADVEALAGRLDLDRFMLAGKSAGGAYALACCIALGSRVSVCGLIAPAAELDRPGSLRGVRQPNRALFAFARRFSFGRRAFVALTGAALRRDPTPLAKGLPGPLAEMARAEALEGYRDRRGQLRELELIVEPWGIKLGSIQVPVLLWQGRNDGNVGDAVGHELSERLPHCRPVFPEGEGADHYWAERHPRQVLSALLDSRD